MDDDYQDLERELKQLRPRSPGPALARRVENALAPAAVPRTHRWIAWFAVPAAAAAAVALFFVRQMTSPAPDGSLANAAAFKPVAAENLLVEARDEGYVTLDDGTTARRVRRSYVDTITWQDPRTNASLVWSVPREEVRVVPVLFQ